jgi:hypothetical protein
MVKVKQCTRRYNKRRGFTGTKRYELVVNNIVNSGNSSIDTPPSVVVTGSKNANINTVSYRKIETVTPSQPRQLLDIKVTGYRIIDSELLAKVISQLLCPECKNPVSLTENKALRKGLASNLLIACVCGFDLNFETSKKAKKSYDINNRIIYTMRTLGQGHAGLEKFTTLMDMPKPMTRNNYNKLVNNLATVAKSVAEETMADASKELRVDKLQEDIVDVGVSVDGSWQKRGFSSNNGVTTAMSIITGKIIDIESMSRLCKGCKQIKKKTLNPVEFAAWKNLHVCKNNYTGSAGGMETVGAQRIFERSISKYNLRYTQYLGDGDSKSYQTVKGTYEDIEVVKLDCIGHFQKRIGSRCRNLKKAVKGLGGRGRLTNVTVDRLQNYFGVAIRQNKGDLEGMRSSATGSLFHVASSKKNNWHYPHCPTGKDSWCRHNRDIANGTTEYKPGPGLPLDIVLKLKPMYQELTSDKYLNRLLHGQTQNQNESFNATIWERIPKSKYVSLTQLEFGVYDAVGTFNIGRKASILVFEKLKMIPGYYTIEGCKYLNAKRLSMSAYKNNDKNKTQRKVLRGSNYKIADKHEQKEGNLYEAGAH